MTNMLQDGVVWLGGQLKNSAGLTVSYSRGAYSVSLTATATYHEYQILDEEGFATVVLSRDYLLHAADVVLNAVQVTPRSGDRITETISGVSVVFEVMPLSESVREYEQLDPDGALLKVHTKKVA